MKIPDILKIGGLYRYAQRSVEELTCEVPPINENDRKTTRLALDYYALIPESIRDASMFWIGIDIINSDKKYCL